MNTIKYSTGHTLLRDQIIAKLSSDQNVILAAPRGYGRRSMVHEIAFRLTEKESNFHICFISLRNVFSKSDFLKLFTDKVLQIASPKEVKLLRKRFSKDDLFKLPSHLANRKKIKILICIGEIQNIARFENPLQFQKELRILWKEQKNCVYLFHGNNWHTIWDIFQTPGKPLSPFGRVNILKMPKLDQLESTIKRQFFDTGKRITPKAIRQIITSTDQHPYYTDLLINLSWWRTAFVCDEQIVKESFEALLHQFNYHFLHITDQLTWKQLHYLKAVLENFEGICSAQNLEKYKLGSSSNVTRIKKSLKKREMIWFFGKEVYFTDPLFRIWLTDFFG
ncbi:MAG: hypothetical protein ABFS10_09730 [Bacteroidota bacterium]